MFSGLQLRTPVRIQKENHPGVPEKSPVKLSGLTSGTHPALICQDTSVANGLGRMETRRFRTTLCRGRTLPPSGYGMILGLTKLAGCCWAVTHGKLPVWMMCVNYTAGWKSN